MSLINCANHDSVWSSQVYSDTHHCLLEQPRPEPSIFVRDSKPFGQLHSRPLVEASRAWKVYHAHQGIWRRAQEVRGDMKEEKNLQKHVRGSHQSQESCPSLFSEIRILGAKYIITVNVHHFLWTNFFCGKRVVSAIHMQLPTTTQYRQLSPWHTFWAACCRAQHLEEDDMVSWGSSPFPLLTCSGKHLISLYPDFSPHNWVC